LKNKKVDVLGTQCIYRYTMSVCLSVGLPNTLALCQNEWS